MSAVSIGNIPAGVARPAGVAPNPNSMHVMISFHNPFVKCSFPNFIRIKDPLVEWLEQFAAHTLFSSATKQTMVLFLPRLYFFELLAHHSIRTPAMIFLGVCGECSINRQHSRRSGPTRRSGPDSMHLMICLRNPFVKCSFPNIIRIKVPLV